MHLLSGGFQALQPNGAMLCASGVLQVCTNVRDGSRVSAVQRMPVLYRPDCLQSVDIC